MKLSVVCLTASNVDKWGVKKSLLVTLLLKNRKCDGKACCQAIVPQWAFQTNSVSQGYL